MKKKIILQTPFFPSFFGLFLLLFVSSCLKKEPLWKPVSLGEGVVDSAAQGAGYNTTIFYRFSDGLKTEKNINSWSLAFENGQNGWHIKVNNGRNTGVSHTENTDFSATYSVAANTVWSYDISSGNLDSTAVGEWLNPATRVSKNEILLVNAGSDMATSQRYFKIQLLAVSDSDYTFRCAHLDGSNPQQISVSKSQTTAYTYFDFVTNTVVDYEPKTSDYDIVFTKYRTLLADGSSFIWYNVNGVLLNPINTFAARLNPTIPFDSLSLSNEVTPTFLADADIIGYDWKYYDLNGTGRYSITPNLYIVKDQNGALWKLTFIGYYSSSGEEGFSQFRYQRIS